MRNTFYLFLLTASIVLSGCKDEEPLGNSNKRPSSNSSQNEWLIPEGLVRDGGPGKDGIPAISNPKFTQASSVDYLRDEDLVIGLKFNEEIKVYPHIILDWHEIVNDEIDDFAFALTYCPLTGTAINWNRTLNGITTTFGVSGLLYNSNLIPYDRETDSNWSQMQLRCVNGQLIGNDISTSQVVETSWKIWKEMYPESSVMTLETGYSRSYGRYPYVTSNGDYRNEEYLIFPVENEDDRLHAKERVLGIIENEEVTVLRFNEFEAGTTIIEVIVGDQKIAVIGSEPDNYIVSFKIEDHDLTVFQSGEAIFKDQNENLYNIFGEIIEGPDTGGRLIPTNSFVGYWFSWAAFYPGLNLYNAQ